MNRIIDHNPQDDFEKAAAKALASGKEEFELAENGQVALDMLAAKEYSIVLMDCQMPVIDGYEATRQIRKRHDEWSKIPIVAMTAHAMKGDKERCLKAGCDGYLQKPIGVSDLRKTVQEYADQIES